jgi:AcrR family transcriptional regulator
VVVDAGQHKKGKSRRARAEVSLAEARCRAWNICHEFGSGLTRKRFHSTLLNPCSVIIEQPPGPLFNIGWSRSGYSENSGGRIGIDRRVARTRTALADALVAHRITVEDIIAEANVGRATLYSHYTSKDDLLRRSLDRLRAHIIAAFQGNSETPFPLDASWNPSRTLFEHVALFADVQATLREGPGGAILRRSMRPSLPTCGPRCLRGLDLPREPVILDMVARTNTALRWTGRR